LSGDWIPVTLPDHLMRVFAGIKVKSLGGATEAAIWSNFHHVDYVDPTWTSIPYGRPIQNARYYVLDHHQRPIPAGLTGDLYIGGTCLAQGYLNREELTADRFLPDPYVAGERIYKTGDLARFWSDGTMDSKAAPTSKSRSVAFASRLVKLKRRCVRSQAYARRCVPRTKTRRDKKRWLPMSNPKPITLWTKTTSSVR
jgi:acyl-CoA synthetase (AMP-forming)/AMP-acid ligase II